MGPGGIVNRACRTWESAAGFHTFVHTFENPSRKAPETFRRDQ